MAIDEMEKTEVAKGLRPETNLSSFTLAQFRDFLAERKKARDI